MRVSILPTDPGYDPGIRSGAVRLDVFHDDVPQAGVLTADDEDGTVLGYLADGDGGWQHANGILLTAERSGVVRIERR